MPGNIIHLIGYPGVGKLTIAKEMVRQAGDHVLIDNHTINNPVFAAVRTDGKAKLPEGVWEKVAQIRSIVLDAIATLSPVDRSFILTNVAINDEEDREECRKIETVAHRRGGRYFPVLISCDIEENKRRIISEDRNVNLKCTDPREPDKMHAGPGLIDYSEHDRVISLDVTHLSPQQAAKTILDAVKSKLSLELKHESHRPHHP